MSSVAQRLLTVEEFWRLPENGTRRELVRGEVVETMPPGGVHGAIAAALVSVLRAWAGALGGYVGVEAGFVLARNPDTVRGADVSYVRADRIPPDGVPEAFWPMAPDLAVEIVSPSETADEVRAKVRDYLAAGTPLVWTIYPRTREVVVHTADGLARAYSDSDVIEHPDVLPGFTCPVAELFA
jgi:Uma2 family endonuclease